jgi:hypothetical protein
MAAAAKAERAPAPGSRRRPGRGAHRESFVRRVCSAGTGDAEAHGRFSEEGTDSNRRQALKVRSFQPWNPHSSGI